MMEIETENIIVDSLIDEKEIEGKDLNFIVSEQNPDVDFSCVPERNIGRLRKTLSEKCPECGKPLQIRIISEPTIEDGEEILEDHEYKVCMFCEQFDEVESKRKKRSGKRNRFEDMEDDVRSNGKKDSQRSRTKKGNGGYRRNDY